MKKVLVVVDMQNDFIDGCLGTKEAQAIVPKVIDKIKKFDGSVVYTEDTHFDYYLDTLEGKKLPVKHCEIFTEGWAIPEVILAPGLEKHLSQGLCPFYEKYTFGSEKLARDLKELCISENAKGNTLEIELIGLCTDICVVSNALLLKAFMPEVIIKVDSSCCAGVTPESHEAALLTMKMCQIDVI